jgi:lipid-A-disaccharide synthase
MLKAFEGLLESDQEVMGVAIYPNEAVRTILYEALEGFPALKDRVQLIANEAQVHGKAALSSSGTMSLACALAGIPAAIVYKANPFTYLMGRMLVNINYLGIANILLDREVMPEYIQENAKPELLLAELSRCLHRPECREGAQAVAEELKALLSPKSDSPTPGTWLLQAL